MADELTQVSGWSYSKNGRTRQLTSTSTEHDVTANTVIEQVQSIGFEAHEAIALGDVATFGFAYFKNLDATNFVRIGIDETGTFHPFIKLLAGQEAQVWLSEAPYAQANTGAVLLDYLIVGR